MHDSQGFSLAEALIALILLTTTIISLLSHQWRTGKLFSELHLHTVGLGVLDNVIEQFYATGMLEPVQQPFSLTTLHFTEKIDLQLGWLTNGRHAHHVRQYGIP